MADIEPAILNGHAESRSLPLARVMLISPVLLYRQGLASSLSTDGRLQVVASTEPVHAEVEVVSNAPDAIILDASNEDGLSLARQIKQSHENSVLVGFGVCGSDAHIVACAEAGIAAFVDESSSIDTLVQAVVGALNGEFRCSPKVSAILCERLASLATRSRSLKGISSLTSRELEVASLISKGLSNKEIALDLRIGPATVKNHVHNILEKLHVRRRAAIAAHAKVS
ncbi:MAG TPA: response regulator transcription factor [Sphingomicrobium sp.]|nr:response regulator transcription factor [Sphingomicrobium sp.]